MSKLTNEQREKRAEKLREHEYAVGYVEGQDDTIDELLKENAHLRRLLGRALPWTARDMTAGRTHYAGCWRWRSHHDCAVALLEEAGEVLEPFAAEANNLMHEDLWASEPAGLYVTDAFHIGDLRAARQLRERLKGESSE